MSIRRYRLQAGFDSQVDVEIDVTKMTPHLAGELNGFWFDARDVLEAAKGDLVEAVARRAGQFFLAKLQQGYTIEGALDEMREAEGWPDPEEAGIRLVDYDLPSIEADDLDVLRLDA